MVSSQFDSCLPASGHPAKARNLKTSSIPGHPKRPQRDNARSRSPPQPPAQRQLASHLVPRLPTDPPSRPTATMAPLTHSLRPVATGAARAVVSRTSSVVPAAAISTTAIRRSESSSFESPFKSPFRGETKGSTIPDFGHYLSPRSSSTNLVFSYFMVGTMGAITAAGAKSTVQGR